MSAGEHEAYNEGFRDCRNDVRFCDCPSKYQGHLRYAWEDGWMKGYERRSW